MQSLEMLEQLLVIARAGEAIMDVYATDFETEVKADKSPVTEADVRAEAVILKGLAEHDAGVPVVAEESVAAGTIPDTSGGVFYLVDPLDGTREFVNRNGEFTVNIGRIEDGKPVMGVVHAPAIGESWLGAQGLGAWHIDASGVRRPAQVRRPPAEGLTVLASRRHGSGEELDAFLAPFRVAEHVGAGSSLKFCRIAQGVADLYPRFGRTMEWDTAAAHAVLAASGGRVTHVGGEVLTYSKPGFENPHFVAWGSPDITGS